MKENYSKKTEKIISELTDTPTLLLQCCCAPCSSYVLEYLSGHFRVTVLFYNPNIYPEEEYTKRYCELKRLISEMPAKNPISVIDTYYNPQEFFDAAKGFENSPEGGERCRKCFELRLNMTAKTAAENGFDYFTTTLTISPLKNADVLNETGMKAAEKYGSRWLPSDFKKKEGYKRSIELSRIYGLYRQNYCGCVYSE